MPVQKMTREDRERDRLADRRFFMESINVQPHTARQHVSPRRGVPAPGKSIGKYEAFLCWLLGTNMVL